MRRILVISIFFIPFALFSQSDMSSCFRLKTINEQIGINLVTLTDPYLSPLKYSGSGLTYSYSGRRFLLKDNTFLSSEERFSLLAGMLLNPQNTSEMEIAQGTYSWGVHRHFPINDMFQILAGGNASGLLGVKYLARNVNNPANVDFAVNINLSVLLRYKFAFGNFKYNLQLRLESPVLGCMFAPPLGASYYEMFYLGNLSNAFHFSSLHNRLGLEYGCTVSFPLRIATIFLDINSNFLTYKANNMLYKFNNSAISIGWKYDLYIFSGTKNSAPSNFLKTDF